MCRHLAYLGPPVSLAALLIRPRHGLYEQSWAPRRQRHGTVNADGFGIGWYPPPEHGLPPEQDPPADPAPGGTTPAAPARYRRAVPVWADANLPDLARTVRSRAVLAAVRSATPGTSGDESAAAPYREGTWLFSHNGAVPDWTGLPASALAPLAPADLLALDARCDTALVWALLVRRLRQGEGPGAALAAVVGALAAARPAARLNLLLTDGRTVFATRHGDTLWYRRAGGAVRVASEPDGTEGWQEVPEGSLLTAAPGAVRTAPLEAPHPAAPPAHAPAAPAQEGTRTA